LDFEGNQVVNGTEGQIVRDLEGTRAALATLVQVFECALRLLSPFMPFITEELWHAVYDGKPPAKSIALTRYPRADTIHRDTDSVIDMGFIQSLVTAIRSNRKELNVEEKAIVDTEINALGGLRKVIDQNLVIIQRLAKVNHIRHVDRFSEGLLKYSNPSFDVAVVYEKKIDVTAERERLTKDIAKFEKIIESSDRQLNNPGFLAKAPAHIVEGLRKQRDEAKRLLDKARGDLDGLPEG
jgi:valyl-tRNA synthetase